MSAEAYRIVEHPDSYELEDSDGFIVAECWHSEVADNIAKCTGIAAVVDQEVKRFEAIDQPTPEAEAALWQMYRVQRLANSIVRGDK